MTCNKLIDAVETAVAPAAGVAKFRSVGLEGTVEYFNSPESDFAGLAAAIAYYHSAENVESDWFAFIADRSGTIVDHYHKEMVGKHIRDIFGTDVIQATPEDVRNWVISQDGMTFGLGWHSGHDEPGS